MRAQVGDEVVVESQLLGRLPRRGRVQEILGSADTEHFRVRWEDGHESVYFPGADGHVVRPAAVPVPPGPRRATAGDESSLAQVTIAADRIDGSATLRVAADVLARSAVGAVVVQEPGSPPALLSQGDVLAALAGGADPDVVWVADIVSSATVWAARDEGLGRAAESMRDARVRHVLVRDRTGLVGIAGLTDVLAALVDARSSAGLVRT
ncbi:MAG TPA: DUF1918 domain-containing protein [Frankiaceae bacterium]|nr:DUF1918 domain-containing protein [Frankiaceae bacterium]